MFGALGLAAVAAILLTTASYASYLDGQGAMVAALERQPTWGMLVPAHAVPVALTNITHIDGKATVLARPNKV